ncbi:chitosanase [Trichophyton rubrum]|uniref:Endo-chitosanase n=1 Tax=Trichophyton rubrum TaxID=5551 RepID=A0A178EZE0_TRIRU|nr:chitosanase [Trichophyton rubrum]
MATLLKLTLYLAVLVFAVLASAARRPVPANLQKLYNHAKAGDFTYCGDHEGIIYITGSSDRAASADMDVDCDGIKRSKGACANDPSGQDQTAFKHEVPRYGIEDLDSNKHAYVVLGTQGSEPSYMPSASNVESLSVVAVFYGVWGDTNGGTDVGEASVSLAHTCFPDEHLSGDNGHEKRDVLYVAFVGVGGYCFAGVMIVVGCIVECS